MRTGKLFVKEKGSIDFEERILRQKSISKVQLDDCLFT